LVSVAKHVGIDRFSDSQRLAEVLDHSGGERSMDENVGWAAGRWESWLRRRGGFALNVRNKLGGLCDSGLVRHHVPKRLKKPALCRRA